MERHRISHRELLERALPLEHLTPDIRALVDEALRSSDTGRHEVASRRAVRALVATGIFRQVEGSGDGPFVFLNRTTGGRIRIDWSEPRGAATLRLPIPPTDERYRIPVATADAILRLDEVLHETEGHSPSAEEVVRRALDLLPNLLPADFVSYLPASRRGDQAPAALLRAWLPDERREVVYIADATHTDSTLHPLPSRDLRSVAIAPVDVGGTRRGFLEVWGRSAGAFSVEQLSVVALFAHQLGETLKRSEAYEKVAFYDGPTGLFNRHFFDAQLEKEMARAARSGDSFGVAIVDIDDFKKINTEYGYIGGNDLLEQMATLLSGSVRPFDIAARWGGEEFALILTPPVGEEEALTICNRIRLAAERNDYAVTDLEGARRSVRLTVSIGVAVFPKQAQTGRELWMAANAALAEAKGTGKNKVVLFSPGMTTNGR